MAIPWRAAAPGLGAARRVAASQADEIQRLAAVRRYDILDTPPDGPFDRVAAMAARLCRAPMATVAIVDSDRVWFKATCGLNGVSQIRRNAGLCDSAIARGDTLVIPDTRADPVARAHPLVTGPPRTRFYAGAPITTPEGYRLGTVNVLDTKPRAMTEAEAGLLTDLAGLVMDTLELRLSALGAARHEHARHKAATRRAAQERAAREQAERDKAALAALAAALQGTLLPPALPAVPGLELSCHYHAASALDVGGDFYDVFPLPGGRWAFFLGDVCGKGAEAAGVTSLARHTLRAAAHHESDPVAVLAALNTALLTDVCAGSRYCTAVFGVLRPAGAGAFEVSLATGGHPPAYRLWPGAGGRGRVDAVRLEGGMLVGAFEDAHFAKRSLRLARGEGLLFYTDGLTEARRDDGTMLGDEGLTACLTRRAGPVSATAVVRDVVALLDRLPEGAGDDVALLAMSVPPARSAATEPSGEEH